MTTAEQSVNRYRVKSLGRWLLTFLLVLAVVGLSVKQCIWESSISSTVFQGSLGGRLLVSF